MPVVYEGETHPNQLVVKLHLSDMKDHILSLFKTHGLVMISFALYLLMWIALFIYLAADRLFNGTLHADRTNYQLMLAFIITLPYTIILMLIATLSDQHRKFYFRLGLILIGPMLISVLLGALNG